MSSQLVRRQLLGKSWKMASRREGKNMASHHFLKMSGMKSRKFSIKLIQVGMEYGMLMSSRHCWMSEIDIDLGCVTCAAAF